MNLQKNKKDQTKIVGILNLSPESFAGESYIDIDSIIIRARQMVDEGADCVDVGAQSTKPGSIQLTVKQELLRLTGVIKAIKKEFLSLLVSIDTTRQECVQLAILEGVDIVNDISGARFDPHILQLIASNNLKYILTHSKGNFTELHKRYIYKDIILDIKEYFSSKIVELKNAGVNMNQIILDPGIGFSKNGQQNIEILKRLEEFHSFGLPLYIGVSRKKFLGTLVGKDNPQERDTATTIVHTYCIQKGVQYIRTHNVDQLKQCVQVVSTII